MDLVQHIQNYPVSNYPIIHIQKIQYLLQVENCFFLYLKSRVMSPCLCIDLSKRKFTYTRFLQHINICVLIEISEGFTFKSFEQVCMSYSCGIALQKLNVEVFISS